MKKVVYSISRFGKFGNSKMTGVGFITDKDLIIACVSQKGNLDMQLGKGLAFIDVNNADKRLLLFLEEQGFISPTGVTKPSGFVVYPLYRLNLDKIGEYKF